MSLGSFPFHPPRYFSLAEAQATVPRLREIFARARSLREGARALVEALEEAGALPDEEVRVDPSAPPAIQAQQRELRERIAQIATLLAEVHELGAEVKAPDGLVDFRSRHMGRVVYLCWKYPEERIAHWHELDAGFAGRQPIGDGAAFHGGLLH